MIRYLYDTDTGFYYLETRFYDPTVGRFISPDDPAYLGASGSVLGWNLLMNLHKDCLAEK